MSTTQLGLFSAEELAAAEGPPPRWWVDHCGHPTANYPWALYFDGELVCAPNGMAFQYKRHAEEAGRLLEAGDLVVHRCGFKAVAWTSVACARFGEEYEIYQAWLRIDRNFLNPRGKR